MHVECCAMRMRRGVGVRSTCPSARFFFPREKEAVKTATVECKVGYNCTIECKVGIRNIITPFTVRTTICHSRRHASIPFGHSTTRRTHPVVTVGHRPSITHAGAAARANSSARGRREHPPLDAAACRVPSRASAVSSALSPRCRCYESRRESKVTRRGYANSGRTRQWHHHRACGGRVNVRRLLPLPLLLLMHPSSGACTTHAPAASNLRAPTRPRAASGVHNRNPDTDKRY